MNNPYCTEVAFDRPLAPSRYRPYMFITVFSEAV